MWWCECNALLSCIAMAANLSPRNREMTIPELFRFYNSKKTTISIFQMWRAVMLHKLGMRLRWASIFKFAESRANREPHVIYPYPSSSKRLSTYELGTHQLVFDKPRVRPVACPLKRETYSLAGPIPRCLLSLSNSSIRQRT